MHTTYKAAELRERQQSYRRRAGSGSKACCDCCSDEQGDRHAEDQKRQEKSSDMVVGESLQLRRRMDVIRLEEGCCGLAPAGNYDHTAARSLPQLGWGRE